MHGLFSREISQKDCLQLFCVISNMVVIKSIINANEMLNKTIEELKQLQLELTEYGNEKYIEYNFESKKAKDKPR